MLSTDVDGYLALRRSLGFALRVDEYMLKSFAQFAEKKGESHVRTAIAVEWAALGPSPGQRDRRLRRVVLFARHMHAEDPTHEIPSAHVFRCPTRRYLPHIYTNHEVCGILEAALSLRPVGSLRPHTYRTLFGLLAATGMRISEAIGLRLDDVTHDGLAIHNTKFQKHRLVPLHPTVAAELERYLAQRCQFDSSCDRVFVSLRRHPLVYQEVNRTFRHIVRELGIRAAFGRRNPRIHDLRHTMAVRALEASPSAHEGVGPHMRALSTYMGHSRVATNYWYLHSSPTLMKTMSDTCEKYMKEEAQ